MSGAIAVLDSGASSIKFSLYEAGGVQVRARGRFEAMHTAPRFVAKDEAGHVLAERTWPSGTPHGHDGAVDHIVGHLRGMLGATPLAAVGHRVVHGGLLYDAPVRVDARMLSQLETFVPLAPLHQPHNLAPIRRLLERASEVAQVACFDTAFHRTQPEIAQMFGLPRKYHDEGVRRFGFHGLSHAYAVRRGAELAGRPVAELRIVTAHLGAGASLAAVLGGVSVDTTMGFTPLAGLVMNTRPGTLDPGLLLWLLEHGQVPLDELGDVLEHRSGLRGLSGTSGDLREVLAGRAAGDAACALALDVYLHRLAREAAAMAAATGGLDLLVLTGGVGEHAWQVRAGLAGALAHLGLGIDDDLNRATTADGDITAPGATVRTVVVTAREDLEIRRQVLGVLAG